MAYRGWDGNIYLIIIWQFHHMIIVNSSSYGHFKKYWILITPVIVIKY